MENEEILTPQDFDRIMGDPYKGDTFIVITDTTSKKMIHLVMCKSVKRRDFVEKIVEHGGKNGRYYWFKNYDEAKARFGDARECKNCSNALWRSRRN